MTRRFQFSLRWILAAPLVVGVIVATLLMDVGYYRGRSVAMAVRIGLMVLPIPMFVIVAQGGRWLRSFGIGAACPAVLGAMIAVRPLLSIPIDNTMPVTLTDLVRQNLADDDLFLYHLRFRTGFVLVGCVVCGVVGLVTSWLVGTKGEK